MKNINVVSVCSINSPLSPVSVEGWGQKSCGNGFIINTWQPPPYSLSPDNRGGKEESCQAPIFPPTIYREPVFLNVYGA